MIALPDFDTSQGGNGIPDVLFLTREQLEKLHSEAFERGRQAGDRDARAVLHKREIALAEDLVQQLHEMTFTHVEARRAILHDLRELVLTFVDVVLPAVADVGLGDLLVSELAAISDQAIPDRITLRCAPSDRDAIARLIGSRTDIPARPAIQCDPELSEGEIVIQSSGRETEINQAGALAALRDKVETYFHLKTEDESHG